MIKYNAKKYDDYYKTEQSTKENAEIKRIMGELEGTILDLGCGTGLGYELTRPNHYLGVDINPEMIKKATKKYGGRFIVYDANNIKNHPDYKCDNVISLFSINYMEEGMITKINQIISNKAIIIHYNKPYLPGSTSAYTDKEELFKRIHQKKKTHIMNELEQANAETTKLLEQEYYYVSIIRKKT